MSDIDDSMVNCHAVTEIDNAFKPQVWREDKLFVLCLIWKDITEIIFGRDNVCYTAEGAGDEMICFVKLDWRPALGAAVFDCKAHVIL